MLPLVWLLLLALLLLERQRRERPLLVYPELKHPAHFLARGIDVVELLARELEAVGLTGPDAPVDSMVVNLVGEGWGIDAN